MEHDDFCCRLGVADTVPDFSIKTFDPVKADFGQISLKEQMKGRKWTILFFYPADFTFV
jgi:peroxiredoxin (alkyl hydroperoxide reductase subunit C)